MPFIEKISVPYDKSRSEDSIVDAIGIWVRTGKSIEEWLKIKGFERREVHRSGWWASLFCVFDAADRMAIGEKIVLSGKSRGVP